jgi:hypothetical protein
MIGPLSPRHAAYLLALHRSCRSATKGVQLGNARVNGQTLVIHGLKLPFTDRFNATPQRSHCCHSCISQHFVW